jgi:hypothetical protein
LFLTKGDNISFFRFLVLICLFLSSLFSRQIEFKGQVLALSGHQNSAEADVVRIQLTAFDVLQKGALPNAAAAWLKNNRELRIAKKDFPAEALKELEVFSAAPFYPLHLPFSQAPAIKNEGLLCSGTFSLMQIEEQWQIKDLQLKDFAFTETIPVATDNGELLSVVIPEIAQFSPLVLPSEIKDLPTEQLSADESLKALDEYGNGYACGTLTSGAYYCGWFQDWRPHGKGQIRYTSGNEYTGDFLYGYRWGYGIYKFKASGDRYEGNFVQSLFDGKGTYYWASGAVFTGIYSEGKRYGEGKYVKGSFSLEGIWVNDVPSGVMTAIERNRWHYNGLWDNAAPHGFGTMRFPSAVNPQPDQYNGDWYEGLFNYWDFHGLGTYHWEDGSEYFGNWVNGIREGNGTYKDYSGLYYDGQWKNNRFHGKGKLIIPKNFTYEGNFENGQTHGQGKSVWDDGREYEGDWVQGQMQGYGTHTWPKSSAARRFTGWFYQGKPKGEGEFETDGLGDNSTILYKTKNWAVAANNGFGGAYTGSIEFRFTDGNRDSYEGEWKDLALNGSGKALFHNGDIYDGEWQNNKFHGEGTYKWNSLATEDDSLVKFYQGKWRDGGILYTGTKGVLDITAVVGDIDGDFDGFPDPDPDPPVKKSGALAVPGQMFAFSAQNTQLLSMLAAAAGAAGGGIVAFISSPAVLTTIAIGTAVGVGIYVYNEATGEQIDKENVKVGYNTRTENRYDGLIYMRIDPQAEKHNPEVRVVYSPVPGEKGMAVFRYVGKSTWGSYECRKYAHNYLNKKYWEMHATNPHTPDKYKFDELDESVPIAQLPLEEQLWINYWGGKPNLQNERNATSLRWINKLKKEHPKVWNTFYERCGIEAEDLF